VTYQDDATKDRANQTKVGFDTDLEASIITSFATVVPGLLAGKKGKAASDDSSVYAVLKSALPSYDKFDPPGSTQGLKTRMTKGAKMAQKRVEAYVAEITDNPEVSVPALGVTRDLVQFICEWTTWTSSMFRELTEDMHYSKEHVWNMLLECWAVMIEEMAAARSFVVDSARIAPSLYDFRQLKSWAIQQHFEENNFGDDLVWTGVMVRQILMHGEDATLKSRLDTLKSFQTKYNKQHQKDQSELKKLSTDLKKHCKKSSH